MGARNSTKFNHSSIEPWCEFCAHFEDAEVLFFNEEKICTFPQHQRPWHKVVQRVDTSNVTGRLIFQVFKVSSFKFIQGHAGSRCMQKKRNVMSSHLHFFAVLSQFRNFTSGQIRILLLLRSDRDRWKSIFQSWRVWFIYLFIYLLWGEKSQTMSSLIQMSCRPCHLPTRRHLSCVLVGLGGWVAPPAVQTGMSVCIQQNWSGGAETF